MTRNEHDANALLAEAHERRLEQARQGARVSARTHVQRFTQGAPRAYVAGDHVGGTFFTPARSRTDLKTKEKA